MTWMRSALAPDLLVALAVSLLVGCAPSPPVTRVILDVPDDDAAPVWGRAPFPSDVWRPDGTFEPQGLEAIFTVNSDALALHLATLDGFGVRPAVELPVDGDLDVGSIDGHAHVFDAAGVEVDYEWRYDETRQAITGAPALGTVLRDGETYTAVLERGVRDVDGQLLEASEGFNDLLAGDVPTRWRSTAAALADADSEAWISVAVFTVQRAQRVVRAGRALLDRGEFPAPELSFPSPALIVAGAALDGLLGQATRFTEGPRQGQERWGTSNPTGIAHDHVGVVATGSMTAARFRRPDNETNGLDDETFAVDADGTPAIASMDTIPFTIIIPEAPAPPSGYPIVIFGHGLGSSRHAVLSFAEPLTEAGFAVVAIDADGHGSRWRDVDKSNNLAAQLEAFSGDASMPDGFGDRTGFVSTFEFLESLDNFSATRDAILQSVLDLCQLVAALRRPDLDLGALPGAPRLDASRVAYLGESFGTILGGILAAIEPDIDLFVLDVPAAGIIDLSILNSPALATFLTPLASALYGTRGTLDRFHPAVALLQALIDPADPLTYAPTVLAERQPVGERVPGPRHVVAIEVVGDEVLHNLASEALARALGLEVLRPHHHVPAMLGVVDSPASGNVDGQTAVLVQYAPATHGANWSSERGTLEFVPGFPHPGFDPFPMLPEPLEVVNPIHETLEQVVEILETHAGNVAPTVRSTLAPLP